MQQQQKGAVTIAIFGYVAMAIGLANLIFYYYRIIQYGQPHDLGVALGSLVPIILGLITLVIAKVIRSLERRLDSLERSRR